MLWCYNTTFSISMISEIIPKSVPQHIFFHHQLSLLCFTTSSFSTPNFYPTTQIILPLTVSLLPDTFPPSSPSLQQHDNYSKKSSVAWTILSSNFFNPLATDLLPDTEKMVDIISSVFNTVYFHGQPRRWCDIADCDWLVISQLKVITQHSIYVWTAAQLLGNRRGLSVSFLSFIIRLTHSFHFQYWHLSPCGYIPRATFIQPLGSANGGGGTVWDIL